MALTKAEQSKRWRAAHPDKAREKAKQYRATHPDKGREASRRWRAANPEKAHGHSKRWRDKNPEKRREKEKRYHAEHPEKLREKNRRHYVAHLEKSRERSRKNSHLRRAADPIKANEKQRVWKHSHPDKRAAYGRKRDMAIAAQSDGTLDLYAVGVLFAEAKDASCPYCGIAMDGRMRSLDHMDPIVKGGVHGISNVLICCQKCNTKKNARSFTKWVAKLDLKFQDSAMALYRKMHGAWPKE